MLTVVIVVGIYFGYFYLSRVRRPVLLSIRIR